jgi:hypothetical protein
MPEAERRVIIARLRVTPLYVICIPVFILGLVAWVWLFGDIVGGHLPRGYYSGAGLLGLPVLLVSLFRILYQRSKSPRSIYVEDDKLIFGDSRQFCEPIADVTASISTGVSPFRSLLLVSRSGKQAWAPLFWFEQPVSSVVDAINLYQRTAE